MVRETLLKNNLCLKYLGINTTKNLHRNLSVERLIEELGEW